ncbi:Uncharacterised protein [Mycobacteroides abscessus subsp. abscessus]|nr:Uncharacterised protein [Mycobacteroides abscessus subsp. abscessus]
MHRDLWVRVVACQAPRFGEQHGAVLVAEPDLGGGDSHAGQPFTQPELGEYTHGVRQHVDADAERFDFTRALQHHHLKTRGVQGEGRRKAADAGPGNHDRCLVCAHVFQHRRTQFRSPRSIC